MRTGLCGVAVLVLALSIAGVEATGTSAIADAAMNRDLAGLRALIAKKIDLNTPQADGSTALHWAAHWDDLEAADLLIGAGANATLAARLGATPLYLASENGSPEMVRRLLSAGADPNETVLQYGETPLMFAARSGNTDSVGILLDAGANVEAKDTFRQTTALMWAAEQNHPAVVKMLLAYGADAAAASKVILPPGRGRRPAAAPPATEAQSGAPAAPVTPDLPDNVRGGVTALIVAVREAGIEAVTALLDGGAPINQQSADGSTALLVAAQNGHADIARLLIERGANTRLANKKGWNPLYLAIKARTLEQGTMPNPNIDDAGMFEVIRLLLEHGAFVNAQLKDDTEVHNGIEATWLREAGATPFLRAAFGGDLAVMKLLLAHGADPKIAATDGTTTLMALAGVGWAEGFLRDFGSEEESLEGMKILLDAGIDVNAMNSDKVTALHGAAHKNFLSAIQLLVDHGADLTARSQRASPFERKGTLGNTALDWASGVQVGMQSSIYHPEAVKLVSKLMTERNIPVEGLSNTKGGFRPR